MFEKFIVNKEKDVIEATPVSQEKMTELTGQDLEEMKEIEITIDLVKDDIDSWDSLKQMDLVLSIENNYDISLEMEEIVKMISVKSIVETIETKNLG